MPLPSTCSGGPRRPWTFEMEADCHESSQKLPFWEFISSCLADKEELKMNPATIVSMGKK